MKPAFKKLGSTAKLFLNFYIILIYSQDGHIFFRIKSELVNDEYKKQKAADY